MVASLKELKKRMSSSPSGPSFRRATPKMMANTTRPRMFIPSTSPPMGTFGQEHMGMGGAVQSTCTVTEGLSCALLGPSRDKTIPQAPSSQGSQSRSRNHPEWTGLGRGNPGEYGNQGRLCCQAWRRGIREGFLEEGAKTRRPGVNEVKGGEGYCSLF